MFRGVVILFVAAALASCSTGVESADDTPLVNPIPGPSTPASLPDEAAGSGTLIVDGLTYEFDVTACAFGSTDGAERGVPIILFSLSGTGVGPGDHPLTVEVERVFVAGDTNTFADSIVLHQPAINFLVQADRSESDGLIIDLREPSATTPMLKLGDGHVTGTGTFGSRGGTDDDPTLPGTLAAGCPAEN